MFEFKGMAFTAPAFALRFVRSGDRWGRVIKRQAMLYLISMRTIYEITFDAIAQTYESASRMSHRNA